MAARFGPSFACERFTSVNGIINVTMDTEKHSVVIVGGGAGGLRAASLLSKKSHYSVTLISKKSTFDHRTSLFRNKSGRSHRHISIPLEKVFRSRRHDIDLVRAEVSSLDPDARTLQAKTGTTYSYDSLIVALEGESRAPHGIDSAATFNAYSASAMDELRRHLIGEFESGAAGGNYVVIGAGETGVEIVAELKRTLDSLNKRYMKGEAKYRAVLVESERVLPKSSLSTGQKVERRLRKKGVDVLAGKEVQKMARGKLHFSDDKVMPATRVILAAGRRANHFFTDSRGVFLLNQQGFVRTNSILEAEGYNNIYVVGNSKEYEHDLNTSGKIYDAEYVVSLMDAKRAGDELREYEPPSYRAHIQLGRTWGVHEGFERTIVGRLGWLRKRWLDLSHFSTLLPTRLWFVAWTRGTRHDEIY